MKDTKIFHKRTEMLMKMSGGDLYQILVSIPGSSGWLPDVDKTLSDLAEMHLEAEAWTEERSSLPLEEQRIRFFSVDREQRTQDQVSDLAAEDGISLADAEKILEDRAKWA